MERKLSCNIPKLLMTQKMFVLATVGNIIFLRRRSLRLRRLQLYSYTYEYNENFSSDSIQSI